LGKIATNILASSNGWSAGDVVCTYGPRDRPFEERHGSIAIAVVVTGSFQYRSAYGSEVMSPGSLLLGNLGQCFQCRHEHGTGDRCLSFYYAPEFFERASWAGTFSVHRIPAIAALAPWVTEARLAIECPHRVALEELAHGLAGAVLGTLGQSRQSSRSPTAADERRISATLRFIEANLSELLPLERLASKAKMSEFHFLRVFKQVTHVTPHQYILHARLCEAALRLKTRSDEVLEIALDAGFRDLSNFNHAFRAEFGVSPSRFRSERH
jgi:AraC family transcriptional regulator